MKTTTKKSFLVLSATVLFIVSIVFGFLTKKIDADENSSDLSYTDVSAVTNHYAGMWTIAEKEILQKDAVKNSGEKRTVDKSKITTDLISLKGDGTFTAKPENGWVPVSAIITDDDPNQASKESISFTQQNGEYIGDYSSLKHSERFGLSITYGYYTQVDLARQCVIANTPYYLTKVVSYMESAVEANGSVEIAALATKEVKEAVDSANAQLKENYDQGFVGDKNSDSYSPPQISITSLNNLMDMLNGGESFSVSAVLSRYKSLSDYEKVRFAISPQYDYASEMKEIATNLESLADSLSQDAVKNYIGQDISTQINTLYGAATDIFTAIEGYEDFLTKYPADRYGEGVLDSGATQIQLAELYTLLSGTETANVKDHTEELFSENICAVTYTFYKGVTQFRVDVTVILKYADTAASDKGKNTTKTLSKELALFVDNRSTRTTIENGLSARLADADVFQIMDSENNYRFNENNYDYKLTTRTESKAYDAATGYIMANTKCTVTYTVKKVKLAANEWMSPTELSFNIGAAYVLPEHKNGAMAYYYTVSNGEGSAQYKQGTAIRIWEAYTITRKESNNTRETTIASLLADSFPADEQSQANVLRSAAIRSSKIEMSYPSDNNALVMTESVNPVGTKIVVSNSSYESNLDLKNISWQIDSIVVHNADENGTVDTYTRATARSTENNIFTVAEDGSVTITHGKTVSYVEVFYSLALPEEYQAEAEKLIGLPAALYKEYAAQKYTLDWMLSGTTFYNDIKNFNQSTLSLIKGFTSSGVTNTTSANAVQRILDNCVDYRSADERLYLYEYLTNYSVTGMSFYYLGDNAEKISYQIKMIRENLSILLADNELKSVAMSDSLATKVWNRMVSMNNVLNQISLGENRQTTYWLPLPNDRIDRSVNGSSAIGGLVEALSVSNDHTISLNMAELRNAAIGMGTTTYGYRLTVEVLSANGSVLNSYNKFMQFDNENNRYSPEKIDAAWEEILNESGLNRTKMFYSVAKDNYPNVIAGQTVGSKIIYTPHSYSIRIQNGNRIVKTETIVYGSPRAVTLPASTDEKNIMRYTIGNASVDVAMEDIVYFFDIDWDGMERWQNRTFVIYQEKIDVYRESIMDLAKDLNDIIASAGLTTVVDGKDTPIMTFIPYEKKGQISFVIRFVAGRPMALKNVLEDIQNTITSMPFTQIYFMEGGNDEFAVWKDGQLSIQAFINMLLNSDLSFKTINDIIVDGKLSEMTQVSQATAVGAVNNVISYENYSIVQTNRPGALLFDLDTYFVKGSSSDYMYQVPVYVTLEDFGKSKDYLSGADKAMEIIRDYVDISLSDGKVNLQVGTPDNLYAYFVAGMLALDIGDIENVNDIDPLDLLNVVLPELNDLLERKQLNTQTLEKTLSKMGIDRDLSPYAERIDNMIERVMDILNKLEEKHPEQIKNSYSYTAQYAINDLFKEFSGLNDAVLSLIKETASGEYPLSVSVKVSFTNINREYEALVFDYKANNIGKLNIYSDLSTALAAVHDNSYILVLKDCTLNDSTKIGHKIVLDLNGKTITVAGGKTFTAEETTVIVDRNILSQEAGGITGKIAGNFRIMEGKYMIGSTVNNISSYLANEYYEQGLDGRVVSRLYSIDREAKNTYIVSLNPAVLIDGDVQAVKYTAASMAADLVLNCYTYGSMTVDGIYVYNTKIDDIFSYVSRDTTKVDVLSAAFEMVGTKGISNTVNKILKILVDFDRIGSSINKSGVNGNLLSLDVMVGTWTLDIKKSESHYITADLLTGRNRQYGTFIFRVGEDAKTEDEVIKYCDALEIVRVNKIEFNWTEFSYGETGVVNKYDGNLGVIVDLSEKKATAAVLAIALADASSSPYLRTELLKAVDGYFETGDVATLNVLLGEVKISEYIRSFEEFSDKTFETTLNRNLIDLPHMSTAQRNGLLTSAQRFEKTTTYLAKALKKLDITGNEKILSSYEVEFGHFKATKTVKTFKLALDVYLLDQIRVEDILLTDVLDKDLGNILYGYDIYKTATESLLGLKGLQIDVKAESINRYTLKQYFNLDFYNYYIEGDLNGNYETPIYLNDLSLTGIDNKVVRNGTCIGVYAKSGSSTISTKPLLNFYVIISGDASGDGYVDLGDIYRTIQCISGFEKFDNMSEVEKIIRTLTIDLNTSSITYEDGVLIFREDEAFDIGDLLKETYKISGADTYESGLQYRVYHSLIQSQTESN